MGIDLDPSAVLWFLGGLLVLICVAAAGGARSAGSERRRRGDTPGKDAP